MRIIKEQRPLFMCTADLFLLTMISYDLVGGQKIWALCLNGLRLVCRLPQSL
jgi:hypothetical protein